jgi:hypothetical protein
MSTIVPLSKYYSFTEDDLEISKQFLDTHKLSYPHLYEADLYNKSFKFIKRDLIDADAITTRMGKEKGNVQDVRLSGLNPEYPEMKVDLEEFGYRLYCTPIAIRKTSDGKYVILNGRTRDKILSGLKIKNRIVDIYECDDATALKFGIASNNERPPAGLATSSDIIEAAKISIRNGWIDSNYDDVYEWVSEACGTRFVEGKRREMVNQVVNHVAALENDQTIVGWANTSEPEAWMKVNNYVDTNGRVPVRYVVYSYSAYSLSLIRACRVAMENPDAEIRVVIHTGNLTAADVVKCYIGRILKFKKEWYSHISEVSHTFFGGKAPSFNRIKLYGCIPALSELSDLDELIIFGKNDSKISTSYLDSRKFSSLFDMDDDYEEEGDEELVD